MPSAVHLILSNAEAKPWRVSKDVGCLPAGIGCGV